MGDKAMKNGPPLELISLDLEGCLAPPLSPCGDPPPPRLLELYEGGSSALRVEGFLSAEELAEPLARLLDGGRAWSSPNRGMPGGELRTIGAAATPTFTALRGPSAGDYQESAAALAALNRALWAPLDLEERLSELFAALSDDRPAAPPPFEGGAGRWLPFNYRAMDPGVQIYAHHDKHYRLPLYEALPAAYDRTKLLSWFVVLQAPEAAGELIIYSLRSDDPNPPLLPTRFLDIEVLERDYERLPVPLAAGDLIIFDSGRLVHRVSPVEGARPRVTVGGFLAFTEDRGEIAFWS